jgi:hypothetical protein
MAKNKPNRPLNQADPPEDNFKNFWKLGSIMANKTEKAGGNPAFFIAELSLKEERKNYFSRPSDFQPLWLVFLFKRHS